MQRFLFYIYSSPHATHGLLLFLSVFVFFFFRGILCERHDVALQIHLTMQFQEVHFKTEEEEIAADDSTAETLV